MVIEEILIGVVLEVFL
jgi:hypothetical protein